MSLLLLSHVCVCLFLVVNVAVVIVIIFIVLFVLGLLLSTAIVVLIMITSARLITVIMMINTSPPSLAEIPDVVIQRCMIYFLLFYLILLFVSLLHMRQDRVFSSRKGECPDSLENGK